LSEELRLRVFENRVLRRIHGPKRVEVSREWRKLHNEELNDLYSLPNILWVIKSRRMRWEGAIARVGREEACTGFWWGSLKERDYLEGPGIDCRIILRWMLEKWGGGMAWIDLPQDRDRWQALVNAVLNLRVAIQCGKFLE
jgi:hypothetical protein